MPFRHQRGFVLLELVLAMLIVTLVATLSVGSLADRLSDASAQASAVWMLAIKKAVTTYIGRYESVLISAQVPDALSDHGYADWSAPGLAELKADRLLSQGFPEQGPAHLKASVRIIRHDDCPGHACRLEALIHSDKPLTRRAGEPPNTQMVAQWLLAAQGWGGTVKESESSRISGASFSFPNPLEPDSNPLQVGTVAMAVTTEQMGYLNYLRLRDTRDPEFQGSVTVDGSLNVGHELFIGALHNPNTACEKDGTISHAYSGGLLVCHDNIWGAVGGSSGGGYAISSLAGCSSATRNPVTGSCSCPAGYEVVMISDNGTSVPGVGRLRGYLCVG